MRLKVIIFATLMVAISIVASYANSQYPRYQVTSTGSFLSLPQSLDNYYEPVSQKNEFKEIMQELQTDYTALDEYVKTQDLDRAQSWSLSLENQYGKFLRMVPEWDPIITTETASLLVNSLQKEDFATARGLLVNLKAECDRCHNTYSTAVHAKYYNRFVNPNVEVKDPVTGVVLAQRQFMMHLQNLKSMTKIKVQEEDYKTAYSNAQSMFAGYEALKDTCYECHSDKETLDRFFGAGYERAKYKLLYGLAKNSRKDIDLGLKITESDFCDVCHRTHRVPAEYLDAYKSRTY